MPDPLPYQTVIGGTALDNEMLWLEQYGNPRAVGSAVYTLGGGVVTQVRILGPTGSRITLQGSRARGWQRASTVAALKVLADSAPSSVTVVLLGTTYTCRFRHEQSGGPVQFERVSGAVPAADQALTGQEWLFGTIYLEVK